MAIWEIHHVQHWYDEIEAETREEAIEKYEELCAADGWDAPYMNQTFARPARKQPRRLPLRVADVQPTGPAPAAVEATGETQ